MSLAGVEFFCELYHQTAEPALLTHQNYSGHMTKQCIFLSTENVFTKKARADPDL